MGRDGCCEECGILERVMYVFMNFTNKGKLFWDGGCYDCRIFNQVNAMK